MIKVGTCGFPLPKAKLAEVFPVAEVQQTFYQPPQLKTLERWRSEVPENFEYTLKAWQLITHPATSPTYRRLSARIDRSSLQEAGAFNPSEIVREAWHVTRQAAEALRANKILFQCPASFRPTESNIENMRRFFNEIQREGLILLWEPRGDWTSQLVSELCTELDLVHVVDPFKSESVTTRLTYYRLHGIGGYRYQYSDEELQELKDLLPASGECYVMFNNSKLLEDGLRFTRMLEGTKFKEA
jgi:uncharacterized protein YecE (DUF72 family)